MPKVTVAINTPLGRDETHKDVSAARLEMLDGAISRMMQPGAEPYASIVMAPVSLLAAQETIVLLRQAAACVAGQHGFVPNGWHGRADDLMAAMAVSAHQAMLKPRLAAIGASRGATVINAPSSAN